MSDDEAFAGGLDDGFGELLEVVDRNNALHLRQQPPEQAEVAAGDANDGPYDLWRRRPGKGAHAQSGPVLLQQVLHFYRSQRPELMDKADARVELRVSRDALFNPGHADQHHAESARIEDGPQLLKAGRSRSASSITISVVGSGIALVLAS